MSRIEDIIARARDRLADPNKERWSDERLLRLVSDAQQDIVLHTEMLKQTVDIPLVVGQFLYALPEDCYRILRCSYDNGQIPLLTYNVMDEQARKEVTNDDNYERDSYYSWPGSDFGIREVTWQDVTGSEVEAVIFDNRNPQQIRFYPIPDSGIADSEYTFENAGPVVFAGDELYGVVTAIEGPPDYTFDSVYGCTTSLYDPSIQTEIFESVYGVVTSISETKGFVRIWYTRKTPELNSLVDELDVPCMYDKALRYFVIAHAYDDDYDTGNMEKSNKALAQYEREFNLARKFNETDGVRNAVYRTNYRSAFE